MRTADFLLELRCEEIPARMQDKAAADLARLFAGEIAKAGLVATGIEVFVTPRRLALIARALPDATAPVSEEVKGPRGDAPAQALAGFLGKTGLTRDQLVERIDAKGNIVLFAVTERPGRPTAEVLAEAIPAIVRAFPWPKSMRWGEASTDMASLRWVRPLSGIVALFGEDLVPVEIAGIMSSATTQGHRFHHPGPITIGSAADYVEKLRLCHVIVSPDERRAIIRDRAASLAAAARLEVIPDEGLVAENAGLTEWPVPLLGRFDPAFLAVPPEVIQLTARVNQKYFVCRDGEGALAPAFVCTANIDAADGGAAIIAGNEKVLSARLSDARFFWEQDLKTSLEEQARKLSGIVFHEKLGTVADKVERVAKLARWLVEEGIVKSSPSKLGEGDHAEHGGGASVPSTTPAAGPSTPGFAGGPPPRENPGEDRKRLADLAETAARLCKADLVTGMVGEFPELQGVMGGYYAAAEGLPLEVSDAIRDHYKPVGQGDAVPTAPVTMAVSLADKLDTLVGFFGIDERPTGSKDPFALRRAANGVIQLILGNVIRVELGPLFIWSEVLETHWRGAGANTPHDEVIAERIRRRFLRRLDRKSRPEPTFQERSLAKRLALDVSKSSIEYELKVEFDARDTLPTFFADRLKVQQREAGVRHDLIDAVFALGGEDDLVRLLARVHALQAFVATPDGTTLLAGYKRAANILKKEGFDAPAQGHANTRAHEPVPQEAALAAALDTVEPAVAQAVVDERFEDAMTALATLRAPIDAFFEGVTVNDPDPATRAARLGLLLRVRDAVHGVADFSRIEG